MLKMFRQKLCSIEDSFLAPVKQIELESPTEKCLNTEYDQAPDTYPIFGITFNLNDDYKNPKQKWISKIKRIQFWSNIIGEYFFLPILKQKSLKGLVVVSASD